MYQNGEINKLYNLASPEDDPKDEGVCSQGVKFDSFFESGNCDLVFEKNPFQYNVYLRVDSNT